MTLVEYGIAIVLAIVVAGAALLPVLASGVNAKLDEANSCMSGGC